MSDLIGGEKPLACSKLESPVLRAHGREAAAYCLRRCVESWPELRTRYGERGRHHVAQDAYWHLEYLDAAVDAGMPWIFFDYADWLVGLLEPRGIGREQVAGAFGFLAEAIEGVFCPEHQGPHRQELARVLRDGQARLLESGARQGPGVPT